jgi:hypothetical protein
MSQEPQADSPQNSCPPEYSESVRNAYQELFDRWLRPKDGEEHDSSADEASRY